MKHLHTHLVTASSSHDQNRGVRNNTPETLCSPKPGHDTHEPIEHCYRTLLETSSSAILLLSSESIILGWNRTAKTLSGWRDDEALGRSYVELCLPMEAREPFLHELSQAATGNNVRGFLSPLRSSSGTQRMLSWNISLVQGSRGNLIGLMAIGTAVASHTRIEEELGLAQAQLRGETRLALIARKEERQRIALTGTEPGSIRKSERAASPIPGLREADFRIDTGSA